MCKPILFLCFLALTGCGISSATIQKINKEISEKYQYLTNDKTMSKAFDAYEFFGGDNCHIRDDSINIVFGKATIGEYTSDFDARFCDVNYYASQNQLWDIFTSEDDPDFKKLKRIQASKFLGNLDNQNNLSDKDMYCLTRLCNFSDLSWRDLDAYCEWAYNDDECIVVRRNLLKNRKLTHWCAFNYKDYIPDYAKIGKYNDFIRLYNAYKKDVEECGYKRNQLIITATEYDECIKSVEDKIEQIVKSGVLK